jgi:hypothetical protein
MNAHEFVCVHGVYRGQHGPEGEDLIQTRLPSVTFSSYEAAHCYAISPNDRFEMPVTPRILKANLCIDRPLPISEHDPFIDAPIILDVMGMEAGSRFLIENAGHIYNTDNWCSRFADEYQSVEEMAKRSPELLSELYIDAYVVLDDPDFVAAAVDKGYDGAVHTGNGETALTKEYRVFCMDRILDLEVVEYIGDSREAATQTAVAA